MILCVCTTLSLVYIYIILNILPQQYFKVNRVLFCLLFSKYEACDFPLYYNMPSYQILSVANQCLQDQPLESRTGLAFPSQIHTLR